MLAAVAIQNWKDNLKRLQGNRFPPLEFRYQLKEQPEVGRTKQRWREKKVTLDSRK
jgi:hypothetical protein